MAEDSETSAAYLRVLKMYEARDERIRKLHEEKQLKKLEEKFSKLNNAEQVDMNVRDRDDGVRVDDGKQIKRFTKEQMRLLKLKLACKDEIWLTEVSADGIPMDYLTPAPWSTEPWFTEVPKDAL